MTAAVVDPLSRLPRRRVIAAVTAGLQGVLALGLTILSLLLPQTIWAAPMFLLFFGVGALAAGIHAYPQLAARWTLFAVRPGTLGAVLFFLLASLHWMVSLGALIGIFLSGELRRSVPSFFGSILTLGAISVLFATSGYFLSTLEKLPQADGDH